MANSLLRRRKMLGFSIESTKGTAETISDPMSGTIVYNIAMNPQALFDNGDRMPDLGSAGELPPVIGAHAGQLSFTTDLVFGDQTMDLLKCCGMSVAADTPTAGDSQATATLDQATHETGTFVLWEDGRKKTLYGAVGTVRIVAANAGARVQCEWTFSGIFLSTPSDQALPSQTPVVTKGWRAASMTATFGGTAFQPADGFTLDLGGQNTMREDMTKAASIFHGVSTDITPTLELAPEATLIATDDVIGALFSGTTGALSLVLTDASGNTFTIASAAAQRVSVDEADRGGKLVDAVTLKLCNSGAAANDHITLTEAAA